ncbi:MAG: diacylglycerol/lipid kinase family protein [Balneolaceae bacterium]
MTKSDQHISFILNPNADGGTAQRHEQKLRKEAEKRWHRFTILDSTSGNFDPSQYDVVVACGGDGTLNQVVNDLIDHTIPIGLLPMGSGNDFAKSLGLPAGLEACLDILQRGHTRKVDAIHCTGDFDRWCINTLGIGFDGTTNRYTQKFKPLFGSFGYVLGAVQAALLFRGTHMRLSAGSHQTESNRLMVTACNGHTQGGSFYIAPAAKIDDGYMDIVAINKVSIPYLLWKLPTFRGTKAVSMKGMERFQTSQLNIRCKEEVDVHIDGEQSPKKVRQLMITIYPGKLTMIA